MFAVTDAVTIKNDTPFDVTIDGEDQHQLFEIIYANPSDETTTFQNLRFVDGFLPDQNIDPPPPSLPAYGSAGAAIYTTEPLEVVDSHIIGNQASRGGAIGAGQQGQELDAKITVTNSHFVDNTAIDEGGAIWEAGQPLVQ